MGLFNIGYKFAGAKMALNFLGIDTTKVQEIFSDFGNKVKEHQEEGHGLAESAWAAIGDTAEELVDMSKSDADNTLNDTEVTKATQELTKTLEDAAGESTSTTDKSKTVDAELGDVANTPEAETEAQME